MWVQTPRAVQFRLDCTICRQCCSCRTFVSSQLPTCTWTPTKVQKLFPFSIFKLKFIVPISVIFSLESRLIFQVQHFPESIPNSIVTVSVTEYPSRNPFDLFNEISCVPYNFKKSYGKCSYVNKDSNNFNFWNFEFIEQK